MRRRYVRLRHRGTGVECPCCGRAWRAFASDWNRPNAICPGCGSQERQRAQWLYLEEKRLVRPGLSLLHFAPEYCLRERLERFEGLGYLTADLDPSLAQVAVDITEMQFPDESFDAIICSHVLEHVADDARAMRELARVLRPTGWLLVNVPLDISLAETLEDPAIRTPDERERAYGQHDHLRLYAPGDVASRLREAGLRVDADHFVDELGDAAIRRYGLAPGEVVFLCRRDC